MVNRPGGAAGEPPRAPDLDRLAATLEASGLPLRAAADGPLAVLVPTAPLPPLDGRLRGQLVTLARDAGFTHVAVELLPVVPPAQGTV